MRPPPQTAETVSPFTVMVTVAPLPSLAMAAEISGRLLSPVWAFAAGVRSEMTGSSSTGISTVPAMATPSASFAETETVSLSPEMSAAGMVTLYVPALSVAGSVLPPRVTVTSPATPKGASMVKVSV